ncbi:MAG: choice-of-anchor V domain-containing protein [Bacteroidales bacterium]
MRPNPIFLVLLAVGSMILFMNFSGEGGLKYPTGAPAGYTGSPGDGMNCTSCHGGTASNTSGIISTDIPPTGYVAGMTYNITVSFSGTGKKGFELSPQKTTGEQVGTLIAGTGSQVLSSGKYITHTQASNATTATWTFQWQAPSQPGMGPVTFYLAHVIKKPNVFLSNLTVNENYHVGIDENKTTCTMNVSPNPASDRVKVSLQLPKEEVGNLSLIALDGSVQEILYTGIFKQGSNDIALILSDHLKSGLYILKLQTGSYNYISKIIINK